LGYGARVHVDPTKTAVAVQQHRFRGGLWIGGAILPLVLGIGGLAFVLVTLFDPHNSVHRTGDYALLACCGFFGFVMPFVAAGGAFLAALREMRRGEAIEALLACMREGRRLDREGLVSLVGKARADRAVIDALALGALTADPPPAPAPPVPAALHVSAPHTPGFAPTMAQNSVRPPHAAQGVASPAHTPGPVLAAPLPVAWAPSASPAHVPPTAIGAHAMPAPRPSPIAGALTPERNSAEQLVGRTLKQTWFVEGLLAAGGMGCVYTARHVRTGKRYAVKTLLPDERISMESLHRFEREARTASSLGHVGIVQVHDFDLEGEPRFLVMDLLEGETLEQRLARVGRLGWQDARRIALEVADALAAAHQAGVLHRDLKPSNVFLARKEGLGERAVLLDFGLTKPIREGASVWVTRTGAIVGTAHYMSPEQARGERGLDQRADVYGLGALIYEMVAGIPPFLGATPFAVLTSLLTEAPVPPSHLMQGIPPALDALVLRALAKQPHERPADVPAMMRELAAL
jgi:tRNA A-37 threonylcarbamoyl transferase component Bud32